MGTRINTLNRLSAQMPVANQRVAQGLDAARTIGMQNAVKQSGGPASSSQIQAGGAAQAEARGQQNLQVAKQNIQQQAQVGQVAINEQRRADDQALHARKMALTKKQSVLSNQLSSLGEATKDRILDSNLSFKRDELGRTLFNERQLADWAINKAKDRVALSQYEQQARQVSERRLKMLDVSLQKLKQSLAQGFDEENQELDQATKKRLLIAKNELEKKIARERARANNRAAMFQAGGTVIGAAAGAAIGGAPGAMIGASIGGGVGSLAGGLGL